MSDDKRVNILYAEDEAITRMLVGDILKNISDVVCAANGAEAFDEFSKGEFDLLITDLSMPKMSGFELIYKIKELKPEIPVIVTTAFREEYFGIEGLAEIIEKPLNIDKFLEIVDKYI